MYTDEFSQLKRFYQVASTTEAVQVAEVSKGKGRCLVCVDSRREELTEEILCSPGSGIVEMVLHGEKKTLRRYENRGIRAVSFHKECAAVQIAGTNVGVLPSEFNDFGQNWSEMLGKHLKVPCREMFLQSDRHRGVLVYLNATGHIFSPLQQGFPPGFTLDVFPETLPDLRKNLNLMVNISFGLNGP